MKTIVSFVAGLLMAAALPAAAKDSLSINGNFQRVGNLTASNSPGALLDMMIGNGKVKITISATNLAPGTNYHLIVGDVEQTLFAGNVRRKANLFFQNFPGQGARPITFDPRGQVLVISDGISNRLTLTIGPNDTSAQTTNIGYHESISLAAVGGVAGTADVSYDQTKGTNGVRSFKLTLTGVGTGTYDLFVDGVYQRSIVVSKGTSGKVLLKAPHGNNDLPLLFEPRNALIQVQNQGVLLFSGVFQAPLPP